MSIADDRDRLIHILVVHYDMFRDKAEEAADLFLHDKALSTPHVGAETGEPVAFREAVMKAYELLNSGAPYSARECKVSYALHQALFPATEAPPAVPNTVGEDKK